MQRDVAGAGQASIALVDLDVGGTLLEVDHVIVPGHPGGHGVGDLVDLGREAFVLDETAQGFGVADQAVLCLRGDEHAGAEVALVVLAAQGVHLAGALEVDFLALVLVGIERPMGALFKLIFTYLRYVKIN